MCGRKLLWRFYCVFALITSLLSLSACNKLPLIEAIFDENFKQPAQYLYLASPVISTDRDIEVKATACRGFSHVAISESASAPVVDSPLWQACINGDTVYTYQFNSTAVGEKNIYFHTRLGYSISDVRKSMKMTYAPKAVIGVDSETDIISYKGSLYTPNGLNTSGSDLWVTDFQNNRILKYNTVPTSNSVMADLILGQPSYKTVTQNYGGVSAYSLGRPLHSFVSGTKLIVADYDNSRVLIWNTIPTGFGVPADVVLGQSSFSVVGSNTGGLSASSMKQPRGIHVVGTKLFVADGGNHRVLVWNTIPTSNTQPADFVLGQTTLASATTAATNMNTPSAITSIGTKLFVTDYGNNRVLVWNTIPTTLNQPADFALGQPAIASNTANAGGLNAASMDNPYRISASGTKLAVTDYGNHRVLIWNTIPTSMQQPADVVLGQPNFTTNTANYGGLSSRSLNAPRDVIFAGNKLVVADGNNNRLLIWNTVPTTNYAPADTVIGQGDFTSSSNHHSPFTGSKAVQGVNMFSDGQRIVASDILLNRVLIWNSIPTTDNQPADIVLGQSNFTSALANRGLASPTASTLNAPLQSLIVGGKLIVNDNANNRLLIWNSMPTANGQAADVVLGQASFTTMTTGTSSIKFNSPYKLFSDGTKLFLPDYTNNRLLIWNTIPTASNTPADTVLGQPSFTTSTANYGGLSASSLNNPYIGFTYGNKLFLADANFRISAWNSIPTTNNQPADFVLGQPNFSSSATVTTNDEMRKVGSVRSLFAFDNKLYSMGINQGFVKIWNKIPTSTFKPADMTYGYSFLRQQTTTPSEVDEFSFQENISDIYTDNYRFIISDRNRILITPYPNVLLSQTPEGRGGRIDLAARSCDGIDKILFNEGARPEADDSQWQDCSTDLDSLHYTISSGSQGRRNIKVWYKDKDGYVLPSLQGIIPYIYDLSPPVAPSVLPTASTIGSNEGLLTNYGGCNGFTEFFASSNPTTPNLSSAWTACGTAAGTLPYSIPEPAIDGPHNVYVWSRDNAGNISASPTVVVVNVDRTPPTSAPALTMQRKDLATVSQFYFAATACGDSAEVLINESDSLPLASNSSWQTCSTATNSLVYTATKETNSIHNLRIWGKDLYDNITPTPRYLTYAPAGIPTIIGQIDAATNFNAKAGLYNPTSVFSDGTRLVVADYANHRVLIWNTVPTTMQQVPDLVLGQDTLYGVAPNHGTFTPGANTLFSPQEAKIFGSKLVVADYNNNRVLIWNSIPTTSGQSADIVLGQPGFTSKLANNGGADADTLNGPTGIAYNGTQFFVADRNNNRVLIWNSFPSVNNQSADVVLGQPDFTSITANKNGLSSTSLNTPFGVDTIGANKLFIADESNHRILVWNTIPTSSTQSADFVLGQTNFTSNSGGTTSSALTSPRRIMNDGTKLYVADTGNSRILIWNTIPTSTGQTANVVVGQTNMTSNGTSSANDKMDNVQSVFAQGTKLFVADRDNNRVSVWNTIPVSNGVAANYTLGQTSTAGATWNQRATLDVNGSYFKTALHVWIDNSHGIVTDQGNSRVLIWNSNVISGPAQVVLGQTNMVSSTAAGGSTGLNNPRASIMIGSKLVVSDYDNNRILIWNTFPTTNGQIPDVVLGQSTLSTSTANQGGVTSGSLYSPYEIATDGTRLIVADRSNSRVLIWNTLPTANKTPANIVLGQPNFTSNTANNGGQSAATLNLPTGVSTDGTRLIVSDYSNSRVLIWNSLNTLTSGQAADIVVGQAAFNASSASTNLNRHRNPHAAIINGGKLYVCDRGNNRILIYDTIPTTNGENASHMIGQTATGTNTVNQNGISSWSFNSPSGMTFYNGLLHIMDTYNDRIVVINPGL